MPPGRRLRDRATTITFSSVLQGDLALILLGEALLLGLVASGAGTGPLQPLRLLLGLAGTLYLPGSALIAALFPHSADLDAGERIAASFALSWVVIPPIALLLDHLPGGLRPGPITLALAIFTAAGVAVAGSRRAHRPKPDVPTGRDGWGAQLDRWWTRQNLPTRIGAATLVALLIAVDLLALGAVVLPGQSNGETAFYLLGPRSLALEYPRVARPGEPVTVTAGIVNRDLRQTVFWIEILEDGRRIGQTGPVPVGSGATRELPLTFTLAPRSEDAEITFLLYRGPEDTPMRSLRLWLAVRADGRADWPAPGPSPRPGPARGDDPPVDGRSPPPDSSGPSRPEHP